MSNSLHSIFGALFEHECVISRVETKKWREKIQTTVKIAIGGDWYLKERKDHQSNLLLVAGGVGINPILSMMRHLAVSRHSWENGFLLFFEVLHAG